MAGAIREKLNHLRIESEAAIVRAEAAEKKIKALEQASLDKDHEIKSLQVRLDRSDTALAKAEQSLKDSKAATQELEASREQIEALNRKLAALEDALDGSKREKKESLDKLRDLDVKAEHCERQLHVVETERDQWVKKCEDAEAKYRQAKAEVDELIAEMEGL
ncbi:actin filament-coating protein tropomyosin [Mycena polygramma]|nr:actin filament-coating protein tropomyosin [Mycena polygramma]